jgi:hypothetical protein
VVVDRQRRFANLRRFAFHRALSREANAKQERASQATAIPFARLARHQRGDELAEEDRA